MSMENHIERLINYVEKTIEIKEYAFLSLGKSNIKAKVKLLKKPNYLRRDITKEIQKFRQKTGAFPSWVKIDIVTEKEVTLFKNVKDELTQTRRNYIDFGIALDQYWNLSFLPEEINTNAFIKPVKTDGKTKFIYLNKI